MSGEILRSSSVLRTLIGEWVGEIFNKFEMSLKCHPAVINWSQKILIIFVLSKRGGRERLAKTYNAVADELLNLDGKTVALFRGITVAGYPARALRYTSPHSSEMRPYISTPAKDYHAQTPPYQKH
jgi:hypothetical protein